MCTRGQRKTIHHPSNLDCHSFEDRAFYSRSFHSTVRDIYGKYAPVARLTSTCAKTPNCAHPAFLQTSAYRCARWRLCSWFCSLGFVATKWCCERFVHHRHVGFASWMVVNVFKFWWLHLVTHALDGLHSPKSSWLPFILSNFNHLVLLDNLFDDFFLSYYHQINSSIYYAKFRSKS